MTPKQAKRDLKAKVRHFMKDATKMAMDSIDKIECTGIVDDHIRNEGNFRTPRDFLVAFTEEMKGQYGMLRKGQSTREDLRRIKNYYTFM